MRARILAPENRKWWTLAAVSFGLFMIMLDNTIVNVALPSIQSSLHLKISELEWVVTGYALEHRRHLPAAPARHRDRHLGGRIGTRARDRPTRRRPDHGAHQLELDLL